VARRHGRIEDHGWTWNGVLAELAARALTWVLFPKSKTMSLVESQKAELRSLTFDPDPLPFQTCLIFATL
jgi:hypothetical protein